VRGIVLGVRFVLELALLGVLGWWGWSVTDGWWRVVSALLLPALAGVVWGMVVAPRARLTVPSIVRVVVEVVLFVAAGAALAWLTHPALGAALVVADLVVIGLLAASVRGRDVGRSPHDIQREAGIGKT
jgi:hypothetical protein